jgi:EAL domain-containing protein (putative c-di-GMP-specific phosphodiesterase class I)
VLQTACEQNKAWQDAGLPPMRMAVNFSPRQFRQHNLIDMIRGALDKSGLQPQWLEFELTENVVLQDEKGMIGVLGELRKMGVCVSLDDFGKGYSSLTHLKHYPVYKLKIGQEFTDQIPLSPDDSAIVKAVIELGHSFHLKVIAEAVEREEQARMLRELGCDEIQGHYFCRPLAAADCTAFLKNHPG